MNAENIESFKLIIDCKKRRLDADIKKDIHLYIFEVIEEYYQSNCPEYESPYLLEKLGGYENFRTCVQKIINNYYPDDTAKERVKKLDFYTNNALEQYKSSHGCWHSFYKEIEGIKQNHLYMNLIVKQYYPDDGLDKKEVEVELIKFNNVITSKNAIVKIKELKRIPASPAVLRQFIKNHPNLKKEFPIIALGHSFDRTEKNLELPCISLQEGFFHCSFKDYSPNYRFLAFNNKFLLLGFY